MARSARARLDGVPLPPFGHAGADAAADEFARPAQRHVDGLAGAAEQAAEVLVGYVVAFRKAGG